MGQFYQSGYQKLASFTFSAPGTTTGILAIPARNYLRVMIALAGFSASDIVVMRFNNDSAANYWTRSLTSNAGGTTFANSALINDDSVRFFPAGSALGKLIISDITNLALSPKSVSSRVQPQTGSPATTGAIVLTNSEWDNSVDQITQIEFSSGSSNFLVGTSITVLGAN